MKIDIWSDIVCPFCYIGKRKFENALQKFEHKEDVKLIWHSYQLYPKMKTQKDSTYFKYLADRDGITTEDIAMEFDFILVMAKEIGLEMNLENVLPLNTRKAHQLLQLAKRKGLGSEAEESLFTSYFVDNKNVDDITVLNKIAEDLGINKGELKTALTSNLIEQAIETDLDLAKSKSINSVPSFIINNEMIINGAQDEKVFLSTLEKAWESLQSNSKEAIASSSGVSCSLDGNCK